MSIFNIVPWKIAPSIPGMEFIRSIGEDLILVKRPSIRPMMGQPFKTVSYVLLLCSEGSMDGVVSMAPRRLDGPGLIFIRPGQVIQFTSCSENFKMHLVILSPAMLSRLDVHLTEVFPPSFLSKMGDNPIVRLQRDDANDIVAIFNLMFRLAKNEDNPYRERSLLNVMRTFCQEAGYYLMKNNPDVLVPQQSPVMERLMTLIRQNFRRHRDVGYYASRLSLSPGYLYKAVMEASGKSVSGWIEDFVVTEAKALLRNRSLTVQQVSLELNFPSQTFFGKYFKRITGLSPKEYRSRIAY